MSLSRVDPKGLTAHGSIKRRRWFRPKIRRPRDRKAAGFCVYALALALALAASCSRQDAIDAWLYSVVG